MRGQLQRSARKVREAGKLLKAAAEESPEIRDDLRLALSAVDCAERRAAEVLREGFAGGR